MTTQGPGVPAQQGGAIVPSLPLAFDGCQVRVVTDEQGSPWFVAADVCTVLAVGNSRDALTRLDDDEKGVASIHTPGGIQSMTTVNEPGLYSLILGSRKPEAKRFKRWVTHEVLPAIRRTGHYGAVPQAAAGLTAEQAAQIAAEVFRRMTPAATTRRTYRTTRRLPETSPATLHLELMRKIHTLAERTSGAIGWRDVTGILSPSQRSTADPDTYLAAARDLEALGAGVISFGARGAVHYAATGAFPTPIY
jgi:prophage antirepressor-like protein